MEEVVGYMMIDPNFLGHEFMYRIDVFEFEGELKLNEIESFDANVRFEILVRYTGSTDFIAFRYFKRSNSGKSLLIPMMTEWKNLRAGLTLTLKNGIKLFGMLSF